MKRWIAVLGVSVSCLALAGQADARVNTLGKGEARQIVSKRVTNIAFNQGPWSNWGMGRCWRKSRLEVHCRTWFVPIYGPDRMSLCHRVYKVKAMSDRRVGLWMWPKVCRD